MTKLTTILAAIALLVVAGCAPTPANAPTAAPVTVTETAPVPVVDDSPPPVEVEPATTAPKPTLRTAPVTYRKITAREWAKIAKNPDSYAGQRVIVHGVVTQFDAATGDDTFRADVDGVTHGDTYEYDTNVMVTGDASKLGDLVADDVFTARVLVLGSLSYDTQIGGETTVPALQVASITVR